MNLAETPIKSRLEAFNYPWLRFFWVPFITMLFTTCGWVIALSDDFASVYMREYGSKALFDVVLSCVYSVVCSEVSLRIFTRLERWYPLAKRLKTLIFLHVIVSSLVWGLMFTLSQALVYGFDTPMKRFIFKQNIILGTMIALSMNVVHIGMILFHRWKKAHSETEELKRVNLEAQNLALKQQIDPHFLFNSLNTLSAMIETEPQDAVRFVQHLSQVYRYVLQSRDQAFVRLQEELDFVKAYSRLLELRFGENINISFEVPESSLNLVVPPLAVQLCVENAVKHNIISRQKPLSIVLRLESWKNGDFVLAVRNNLQPRKSEQPSTNVGLTSILRRYSLITTTPVQITRTDAEFIVHLPLLSADLPQHKEGVSSIGSLFYQPSEETKQTKSSHYLSHHVLHSEAEV